MSLCSKPLVSLWPLAENSPVCEMMRSITSIDTSKGCLKLASFLLQHSTSHLGFTDPFLLAEKRLWCCLPKTWARAKLLSGGTQLCESCSAATRWDALTTRALRQSSEWCGSMWSRINPVDRVEIPASGLAQKKIHLVTPSCGVTGLQYPEEQKQAVNQGQLLLWSLN